MNEIGDSGQIRNLQMINVESILFVYAQHHAQLNSILKRTALLWGVQGLELRKYALDSGTGWLQEGEVV